MRVIIALLLSITVVPPLLARGVYQQPEDFINEVFAGDTPAAQILWLTRNLRPKVEDILGHKPDALRIRYWKQNNRSVWILEEIGKEQPITAGIVVHNSAIERIKVLTFRESRGWEVRHPFFTGQFKGIALAEDNQLNRPIDGISGATLSVRALKKLARLALF